MMMKGLLRIELTDERVFHIEEMFSGASAKVTLDQCSLHFQDDGQYAFHIDGWRLVMVDADHAIKLRRLGVHFVN